MAAFWLGVLAVPALVVIVVLSWVAIVLGPTAFERVARRAGRSHWVLSGPQVRNPRPAGEIFRRVNARGRHLASLRRLVAVGPWTIYLGRYKPGHVEDQP